MSDKDIKLKRDALNHRNILCSNMADLREEIDILDCHIVELLSIRQGYMEQAATIKQSRNLVRDEERVEDVLTKVLAHAKKTGTHLVLVEMTYRNMIEWCINFEFSEFDKIQNQTPKKS